MSIKLTWDGKGTLDVPHVLDTQGIPLYFSHQGSEAFIDPASLKHPYIQNQIKKGDLHATPLEPVNSPPEPQVLPVENPHDVSVVDAKIESELDTKKRRRHR